MNRYDKLITDLQDGEGKMKAFGNSMMPIIKSGSLLTFKKQDEYFINDIVFCRVKGRYIDAHKVIALDKRKGYLIANNKGFQNGWTRIVYGKVVKAEYGNEVKDFK